MNQIKIGKFIANLRKEKKLTQEQLAEKLYVTDRAVSKWERGLSLPDASNMLDLCNVLDISVNELLVGEKIDMKDLSKKTEELLLEMKRQDEYKNKTLLTNMFIMFGTTLLLYFGIIFLAIATLKEGFVLGTIIVCSTMILILVGIYASKLEVDAGYYECKKCHHRYVPTSFFKTMISPHIHTTRYLKCPKCNEKSWSKKVMTKE